MGLKIQRKDENGVDFEALSVGAIFIDEDGDINIKSHNDVHDRFYAIVLNTGTMWDPPLRGYKVKEIFPTLIIDNK